MNDKGVVMIDEAPSMAGKTVLVTGVTGGIGKGTAIGLAALGARVGIIGRDLKRVEAAAVEVLGATGNPQVDAFGADLSSQAEVRRLAAEVLDAYPRVDVLVNNAPRTSPDAARRLVTHASGATSPRNAAVTDGW
jgi:NAD(P)-dependent dehydrogenase (short-subunit alcohol dehydrogenase family)